MAGTIQLEVQHIPTKPFRDQRPGTSGLRKKTRHFMQPHYLENFVQAIFDVVRDETQIGCEKATLVVGGDGRYYNREAIQIILRLAVANGFGRMMIGIGGILSTPAMSAVIRQYGAIGGLILSASHNPGGIDEDFGIKYNTCNGSPATEELTERVYQKTLTISQYCIVPTEPIDLDRKGEYQFGTTDVVVFDPICDYVNMMRGLFDFEALRGFFHRGGRMIFDAMHAVTGPYAHYLLETCLDAPIGTVVNGTPLENFGGSHADPNQVHAAALVTRMAADNTLELGAASDGDGDRNMILGPNCFVSPGDSLAIIADYAQSCIPGYRNGLMGVARSMPTSTAIDRVAAAHSIPCYETPAGWKFFSNLLEANLCTICGEESFGTGSSHIREKDGLWAVLCWLSILTYTGQTVPEVLRHHWQRFGRSYYQRHDYEGLKLTTATALLDALRGKLSTLPGLLCAGEYIVKADDFSYIDPVDGIATTGQGIRVILSNGSRFICRLSGTETDGATLRLYLERYHRDFWDEPIESVLAPLIRAARHILDLQRWCGHEEPTLVT